MKKSILFICALFFGLMAFGADYSLSSPSGELVMNISTGAKTTWGLKVNGADVLAGNRICMKLTDGTVLGDNTKVKKTSKGSKSESIEAPFYRQAKFDAQYNYLIINFKGDYSLEFRAYDDGVAYRFLTNSKNDLNIADESVEFSFCEKYNMFVPFVEMRSDRYETSFESQYTEIRIGEDSGTMGTVGKRTPANDNLVFTPVYIDLEDKGKLLLMESDVEDYPGLFLVRSDKGFTSEFSPLPGETTKSGRGVARPKNYKNYIASVSGKRTYPWRIVGYGKADKDLPTNNMVYQLASPNRIASTSWIKPGQSTWDWWNGVRRYGVDFEAGMNTDTYKYDIDFAAKQGMSYVLIDEGWYKHLDIMNISPDIDLQELCKYGKQKGVRLVLWTTNGVLDDKLEEACKYYSSLGIAGFKVDFFDAQDQATVQQVYRICDVCAQNKLILDLHGIYKPTGLSRTYPNVLNYEGVYGLEQLKWTDGKKVDMPRNDVIIPFIRMVPGPIDYTQGALRNAPKNDFRPVDLRPMSQGTRAHQVGAYVVFDSPYVMLCDSPSDYLREEETTSYINSIPTTFDSTDILAGEIGKYIITARKKGNKWYVGGLCSWDGRTVDVNLGFLPAGKHSAKIFRDGVNSEKVGTDYKLEQIEVNNSSVISVKMASGGGFAMIID